jgi:SH3-like domain-containing protein
MRSFSFILIFCLFAAAAQAKMLSVAGAKVNLRTGPGSKYAVRWEYGRGFPVRVLSRRGNWYKVKDFEGDRGWIYRKLLSSQPHVIVKRKVANIRTGPGTRYRLLGKANYGVVFLTLSKKRGWVKVRHAHGLIGWIKQNLLWGW